MQFQGYILEPLHSRGASDILRYDEIDIPIRSRETGAIAPCSLRLARARGAELDVVVSAYNFVVQWQRAVADLDFCRRRGAFLTPPGPAFAVAISPAPSAVGVGSPAAAGATLRRRCWRNAGRQVYNRNRLDIYDQPRSERIIWSHSSPGANASSQSSFSRLSRWQGWPWPPPGAPTRSACTASS